MEGKQIKRLRWWLYNAFTHYIVKSQINCLNFNSALNFREKNTRKQMCRLSMNLSVKYELSQKLSYALVSKEST